MALLALLPILTVFALLVVWRWPAVRAMPAAYVVTVVLAVVVWKMEPMVVAAASIKGLIICFALMWIIFGALVLLTTLRESGAMAVIRKTILPLVYYLLVGGLLGGLFCSVLFRTVF